MKNYAMVNQIIVEEKQEDFRFLTKNAIGSKKEKAKEVTDTSWFVILGQVIFLIFLILFAIWKERKECGKYPDECDGQDENCKRKTCPWFEIPDYPNDP